MDRSAENNPLILLNILSFFCPRIFIQAIIAYFLLQTEAFEFNLSDYIPVPPQNADFQHGFEVEPILGIVLE